MKQLSFLILVVFVCMCTGCVTPAKRKSNLEIAQEDYLKCKALCDDTYENLRKASDQLRDEHTSLDKRWDEFYFPLSNEQIDLMHNYLKYGNKESMIAFRSAISTEQWVTFYQIRRDYKELDTVSRDFEKKTGEIFAYCEKTIAEARQIIRDVARLEGARLAMSASETSSMIDGFSALSRDIRQMHRDSRAVRSLEGIELNLQGIRRGY